VVSISGPKVGDIMGGCRKLHNEEYHNLYFSHNIKVTEQGGEAITF
jgi:hypothetical protein